ncbi:3-hydroxyacyl-ACP dehydratase [Cytophaga hutchinsonii]|jgi:3-hydroxyacyl-[acyl-carrier-protein] dehydratase|uniref:3-hydroxyacyl-ACP dehydratase n=1 Tax=Cytophaga hutchinsonii TaxID=985 RepID=UPI00003C869D|nr:3-hydroxyacyl-ACP dehydratase [Cytophaga hutchinsonii]SFX92717.1 3-hydroxymyristoyl/3-hydroxydecanoyl-(acyl carrier protein) dehydratase [Cytophaga hutchinsonii ATCC 33406]
MAAVLPDKNVIQYIPQRPPIVMISTLVSAEKNVTETELEIPAHGLFVKDGVLHEPGLIENVAQTAAAGVGYACTLTSQPVPVGFIGAVKNLEIDYLPKVGDVLETRVEVLEEIFDMTLIKGESFVKGKRVLTCEMKIVLKK